MKFIKIILPAAFLILFCSELLAQKPTFNYVINKKGDTIKCDFKKPLLGRLRYQPIGANSFIKVTTDEIIEYYTVKDSTLSVAAVLPNNTEPEFLTLLERGKINMYEKIVTSYSQYGSTTTFYWYINKDGDLLKQLKATTIFTDGSRKDRKNMFADMIADDPTLMEQFKADNDFSIKRLQYYVHQYNEDVLHLDARHVNNK